MTVSGPFFFVGLRFGTAALALTLFSLNSLRGLTWYECKAGILIGVTIAVGYSLQSIGLQTISSSQSAFITAMYVPMVPLLQWLVLKRFPGLMAWVGILLAFSGLMLLAGPSNSEVSFSLGETVTLIGTVAVAAEIILIGAYAGKVNVRRVTVIQLATASQLSFLMMLPSGEAVPAYSDYLLYCAVGLGIASALIQLTMPEIQPSAPTAMLSTTASSSPANSTKRSPTVLRRSIKRLVSPEESLKQTMLSQSASEIRMSGVTSFL